MLQLVGLLGGALHLLLFLPLLVVAFLLLYVGGEVTPKHAERRVVLGLPPVRRSANERNASVAVQLISKTASDSGLKAAVNEKIKTSEDAS